MLDARNILPSVTGAHLDDFDVDVNHWDDDPGLEASADISTSHTSFESGPRNELGVTTLLPGTVGLRSRKPGTKRRLRTADGSLSSHPLQMQLVSDGNGSTVDDTATRPLLRRWLSKGAADDEMAPEYTDSHEEHSQQGLNGDAETMVLIHEVSRTDSLAGVALKYGMALADLRKANQLWASDTIHMRKILYIPLHLTDKKRLHFDIDAMICDGTEVFEAGSSAGRNLPVVQRVPVSQLSFFPPSSQPPQPPCEKVERAPSASGRHAHPTAFSLQTSSLLQSLSFPSRDTFFPRLSSESSETSSTTNPSELSSDQEHEMDVLGQSRRRDRTPTAKSTFFPNKDPATPTERVRKYSGLDLSQDTLYPASVPLQTEQLKPSPRMEFPGSSRGPDG